MIKRAIKILYDYDYLNDIDMFILKRINKDLYCDEFINNIDESHILKLINNNNDDVNDDVNDGVNDDLIKLLCKYGYHVFLLGMYLKLLKDLDKNNNDELTEFLNKCSLNLTINGYIYLVNYFFNLGSNNYNECYLHASYHGHTLIIIYFLYIFKHSVNDDIT